MRRFLILLVTHTGALAVGFAMGVYLLPILTAPDSPDESVLESAAEDAMFTAEFVRGQRGNDLLHWGEGSVSITPTQIVHQGTLAPGPDYRMYLVQEYVEHEDEFLPIKQNAQLIGEVKTFDGVILDVPENVDVTEYTTVLIWCEAFGEFIASAQYR